MRAEQSAYETMVYLAKPEDWYDIWSATYPLVKNMKSKGKGGKMKKGGC